MLLVLVPESEYNSDDTDQERVDEVGRKVEEALLGRVFPDHEDKCSSAEGLRRNGQGLHKHEAQSQQQKVEVPYTVGTWLDRDVAAALANLHHFFKRKK